jgi:DNA polymerase-3 subunit epsilon
MVERIFMTTQRNSLPAWCQHIVSNPDRFVVLDSETTDLRGEICDLAIVTPDGKVLFNKLLRPKCPIEEGAMAVHGITEAMVATARTFAEEWPEISSILESKVIIAYNEGFDKERLWHTAREHGITPPHRWCWDCLMLRYARFWNEPNRRGYGDPAWQKLEAACRQQSINVTQEHRALSDAMATVALIRRIAELGDAAARWNGEALEEV